MKKNLVYVFALILAFSLLAACKTTGQFSGTASLSIMIVDEKGQALKDFNLVLSNFNRSEKGITNSNGLCVFNNIPSGQYELSGSKTGYSRLMNARINFIDKCEIFCFGVQSGDSIFSEVEKYYEEKEYKEGLVLLDELICQKKSFLYGAVCYFKAYAYICLNNNKAAQSEIKKMKALDQSYMGQYKKSLEEMLKEIEVEEEENKNEVL